MTVGATNKIAFAAAAAVVEKCENSRNIVFISCDRINNSWRKVINYKRPIDYSTQANGICLTSWTTASFRSFLVGMKSFQRFAPTRRAGARFCQGIWNAVIESIAINFVTLQSLFCWRHLDHPSLCR